MQRSLEECDRWGEGRGILYFEASVVQLKDITPLAAQVRARREAFCFWTIFYFGGCSEAAMGGGGVQRPVWHDYKPKKTGVHSARARTLGQNPLVYQMFT